MKNRNTLLLSLFIGSLGYGVELKNTQVTFEAVGKPAFIKIKGEGKKLNHSIKEENGVRYDVFEFAMDDLNTGIDMRDEHMKEKYLNTKEFPTAFLKIQSGPKDLFDFPIEHQTQGLLTLRGQTKPVNVKATKKASVIVSEFEIKLSDFGIEIPTYTGITVADTVKVRSQFETVLNNPALVR